MAQAGLVGFIIAAGLALQALSLNLDSAIVPASALVSLVVLWSYYSWHLLGRRWFGPYGLFLLSASLFNGGQAFLELLRLNPNGVLGGAFSPELTVKALYLVALGLSALHLGALWAVDTARRNGEVRASGSDEERSRATRLVGWSCIAISAIPMAMVIEDMLSTVASRGYAGLYGRAAADILPSTIRIFATAMIPGIMFLAAGGQKRRFLIASVWILVMGNSAILMLSGLRSGAALLLISFAWLYDARIRRLSRSILLSVGVGMLAVFAIVGVAREYQVSWRESLGTKPLENPLVAAISEMGGTLGTVAHTINLFPSVRPFDDGVGYVYAISAVLPNVGWDSHPAQAHGSYGEWLVRTVDGRTADLGQGLGFSFIAEPFANFGWYGVAPVLGLLGYLLVKMTDWATLTGDPARYAAVATFLMSLLFFARGESASVFRPFVYYSVLPYAAVCMICQGGCGPSTIQESSGLDISDRGSGWPAREFEPAARCPDRPNRSPCWNRATLPELAMKHSAASAMLENPLSGNHGVLQSDSRPGAPLRVLHVINTLSAGGAEVLVTELAIALSKCCEVKVWTYGGVHDPKGNSLCARLKRADIEVTSAGISNKSQMIAIPALLARFINRYRPHIVHAHLEQSELFAALSMYLCRRRPLLIRSTHSTRLVLPLTRILRPWLAGRFDWSIAVSKAALNSLEHALPKSRACAIDNGISLPPLGDRAVLRQEVRAGLHVGAGRKVLLQIGAMRGTPKPKAHDLVIEAFASGDFMRTSDLVFLGDGPGREDLEARAKELGVRSAIHFCGIVGDVADYILAADVVLMPSRYEGFGLAAAEAACLGAPMVLSDIEALRPFASKATLFCAPGDVESLITAMRNSLDHCDEMWHEGEKLIPVVRERVDITGVAKRYFELYTELTASEPHKT